MDQLIQNLNSIS